MITPRNGGQAFPIQMRVSPGSAIEWGMTVRQWYKGQVIAGMLDATVTPDDVDRAVRLCAEIADALLAEDAKHAEEYAAE